MFGISSTGLWLLQRNREGPAYLNAQRVRDEGTTLDDVRIVAQDDKDHFLALVTAKSAHLMDGYWELDRRHRALDRPRELAGATR